LRFGLRGLASLSLPQLYALRARAGETASGWARFYRRLGMGTPGVEFNDFAGRPIPILNEGTPIPELGCKA
jgi:hypothetical protein